MSRWKSCVLGQNLWLPRKETGEEGSISPKQTRAFSVYQRQPIEIAAGERLMLTANRRGPELRATNGELVNVSSLDGGAIHLEDGRTLPANYHEFTHGYAVTAHRSQGKTVDTVIISTDAMKQELFYVAASRGRMRSLSSQATASNFVNLSAYQRCGSPLSSWLENSYPRTMWKRTRCWPRDWSEPASRTADRRAAFFRSDSKTR